MIIPSYLFFEPSSSLWHYAIKIISIFFPKIKLFFECYASLFAFLFLVLLFVKEGWFSLVYKKQYSSSLLSNTLTGKLLFILWVYCSFFLLFTARRYFFWVNGKMFFNLPVKTHKKICSGRAFGNRKIFQPGNWKGFLYYASYCLQGYKKPFQLPG